MAKLNFKLALVGAMTMAVASCSSDADRLNSEVAAENYSKVAANTAAFGETEGILIKFKEGTSEGKKQDVFAKIGGKVNEKVLTKMMERKGQKEAVNVVSVSINAFEAISKAKGMDGVEYVEPNYVYEHHATSNDTYFTNGSLWGMYGASTSPANQYGTNAAAQWAAGSTGSNTVYVGIIDEGYMYTHEDIAANAGVNPGEIAGNGVDDDKNGLVDDVYGYDFANNDTQVFDDAGDDHGTHVAGTIGAVGGNGKGVAGMVWNVKLLSAKFLGKRGGTTANAIKAVDYFTDLKLRSGINLVATNNSWGGGGFSQALFDAIERANQAGILFVAAAGNDGSNNDTTTTGYPSKYTNDNIIAVASITNTGGLSSFSNYGATTCDIAAPGSGIWSSVPQSSKGKIVSAYASYNGTSMATPHVTGAVALYASKHPGSSASQIKGAILSSATPTASCAGKMTTGGRLNVSSF